MRVLSAIPASSADSTGIPLPCRIQSGWPYMPFRPRYRADLDKLLILYGHMVAHEIILHMTAYGHIIGMEGFIV